MDENRYITDNVLRRYLGMDEYNPQQPRDDRGRWSKMKTEDFLGKEYKGVTGQDAIDLLMRERKGFVRSAFTRKDVGNISLVWGNDNMGLQHIIKRRKETKQPLGKLLSSLTEVIQNGEIGEQDDGRFRLRYKGKVAIIEPKLLCGEISFLFTAFYEQ